MRNSELSHQASPPNELVNLVVGWGGNSEFRITHSELKICAAMLELADRYGSGPYASNCVRVRLPLAAIGGNA